MLVIGAQALVGRDPATMAYGTIAVAVALSGLYDFTWSFPPLLLLGAVAAVVCTRADRSGQPIRRTRDDHKRLW
jgi:hypothetical protein